MVHGGMVQGTASSIVSNLDDETFIHGYTALIKMLDVYVLHIENSKLLFTLIRTVTTDQY